MCEVDHDRIGVVLHHVDLADHRHAALGVDEDPLAHAEAGGQAPQRACFCFGHAPRRACAHLMEDAGGCSPALPRSRRGPCGACGRYTISCFSESSPPHVLQQHFRVASVRNQRAAVSTVRCARRVTSRRWPRPAAPDRGRPALQGRSLLGAYGDGAEQRYERQADGIIVSLTLLGLPAKRLCLVVATRAAG